MTHDPNLKPLRFLRRREVERRTGLSRSSIYAYMQAGQFPKAVRIGPKAVAWLESDVSAFIIARCKQLGFEPLWETQKEAR